MRALQSPDGPPGEAASPGAPAVAIKGQEMDLTEEQGRVRGREDGVSWLTKGPIASVYIIFPTV